MASFGELLRQQREAKGWTQSMLADESEVSLRTIQDYEQGRREPGFEAAAKLATALGVSTDVFREQPATPKKRGNK